MPKKKKQGKQKEQISDDQSQILLTRIPRAAPGCIREAKRRDAGNSAYSKDDPRDEDYFEEKNITKGIKREMIPKFRRERMRSDWNGYQELLAVSDTEELHIAATTKTCEGGSSKTVTFDVPDGDIPLSHALPLDNASYGVYFPKECAYANAGSSLNTWYGFQTGDEHSGTTSLGFPGAADRVGYYSKLIATLSTRSAATNKNGEESVAAFCNLG